MKHTTKNISLRNNKFNFELVEGGSGPDIIYLHGSQGFFGWTPFLEALSNHFHVYAIAHPGVSTSEGLEHLDDLWDLVLIYEELIQELKIKQTAIVGHSYGGMLAAEIAAHRPDIVSHLVLISSLGLWLEDFPVPDIFMLTASELSEHFWYDPNGPLTKSYIPSPQDEHEKQETNLDRTKTLMAVGKFCWPLPDKGLRKRIHRITMPTLLVWGDHDKIVPPIYGQHFQDHIPNSQLTTITNCGHIPEIEQPEKLRELTLDFLLSQQST